MQKFILTSLLLLFIQTVFAQTPSQQAVQNNINTYGNNNPQEKVYIHFDRQRYAAGDTVWFKAYLMTGADVSNISKTFYVDFLDEGGNVLLHGAYPVWNGSAIGNFGINGKYAGESIRVNAYTKWMLNFDTSFLYRKNIPIIPATAAATKTGVKPMRAVSLQFFPEAGDCIQGVKTKIAFKANYQNGLPAVITGVVTDSKGSVIDSIKTLHDGMGFFYLEAQPGETYKAK